MRRDPSPALLTDLYELTMAAALFAEGKAEVPAAFSLFARTLPPRRGYLVAAGLDDAMDYLEGLRFTGEDLAALARLRLGPASGRFDPAFLDWLGEIRFTGVVRAVPEGRLVFAGEPLLEVEGPLGVTQLAETFLLNQVSVQTTLATKAARCRHAAGGRALVDFALRRAHGTDAGMKVARCSAIAGFAATSNVAAAVRYGLAASGTMAHSYVLAHDSEDDAFARFAELSPGEIILLVDTYDSATGIERAIACGGQALRGIRLDSGDLDGLARLARRRLDDAGLTHTLVLVSGGLDEHTIAGLVAAGAPIDGFGVGTSLGVSEDAPALETVYKLVQVDGRAVAKRSPGKATLPGAKQVWRTGGFGGDVLGLAGEAGPPGSHPLLEVVPPTRPGPADQVAAARARFAADWAELPDSYKDLVNPANYPVLLSAGLERLKAVHHPTEEGGPPA
ncbi:MAG: nicotinate phosphoribosyltransferase [Acidimicrobiia bacterium]